MSKTISRVGDVLTIVEIEERYAVVPFSAILAACRVEADFGAAAPWENCDGYEHDVEWNPVRRCDHIERAEEIPNMHGYGWSNTNRAPFLITLHYSVPSNWGYTFGGFRQMGMSKQVAREALAAIKRRTLAQLVKWYSDGWESYAVVCEYLEYSDSCGGYDSYEYAHDQQREHALEVAAQMEADGYTVEGKPDITAEYEQNQRASKLARLRYNLSLDCWNDSIS